MKVPFAARVAGVISLAFFATAAAKADSDQLLNAVIAGAEANENAIQHGSAKYRFRLKGGTGAERESQYEVSLSGGCVRYDLDSVCHIITPDAYTVYNRREPKAIGVIVQDPKFRQRPPISLHCMGLPEPRRLAAQLRSMQALDDTSVRAEHDEGLIRISLESKSLNVREEYHIDPACGYGVVKYRQWIISRPAEPSLESNAAYIRSDGGPFIIKEMSLVTRVLDEKRQWQVLQEWKASLLCGTTTVKPDPKIFELEGLGLAEGTRIQDRINVRDYLFGVTPQPISERLERAVSNSRLARQHVLIVITDPSHDLGKQLGNVLSQDSEVRKALRAFQVVVVDSRTEDAQKAETLGRIFQEDLTQSSLPLLIAANADGMPLATLKLDSADRPTDRTMLLAFLEKHSPTPLDARKLLDDALRQAKMENKRVLLQETATWCGPCWMLSRFFEDSRSELQSDYVWVKLDHRWTGCDEVMKSLGREARLGIPWWAILDSDGQILVTSVNAAGENIGFPGSPAGIEHFRAMLGTTAIRMTTQQIAELVDTLKE